MVCQDCGTQMFTQGIYGYCPNCCSFAKQKIDQRTKRIKKIVRYNYREGLQILKGQTNLGLIAVVH